MATDVSNGDKVIDSRDVIARLEELEAERNELQESLEESKEAANRLPREGDGQAPNSVANDDYDLAARLQPRQEILQEWDDDNGEELEALKKLNEEGEQNAGDWEHGATLIREDYFTEYCEELLQDIGDLPKDVPGYLVIDWEKTADNLKADYSEVDFDGETYLVRS